MVTLPSTFISATLLTHVVMMTRPDLIEVTHNILYFFFLGVVPAVVNFQGLMSSRIGRMGIVLHLISSFKVASMLATILDQTAQDFAGSPEKVILSLAIIITFNVAVSVVSVSTIYKILFKENPIYFKEANLSIIEGYQTMKKVLKTKVK